MESINSKIDYVISWTVYAMVWYFLVTRIIDLSKTFNYIRQVLNIIENGIKNTRNLKIFAEINNEF